ncbi:uncharacterized protein LOC126899839 [Daktulosphaira vitifoliae]|uniref:uncharacterized protein LOC126899839 n=1 Tax=Daktulosphaira vitifoliae TaxID=58002 RepID=UPI0021AA648F|nr:uncharacterized protein LOC126899839 [Daktulosphaira vitifoliae]
MCKLQEKTATLGKAANIIKSVIKSFESLRTSPCFTEIWNEILLFMNEHNLDIEISSQDSKRKRLQPNSLKNFVVSTPTSDQYKSNENIKKISVEDHFRTSAFFQL